MCGWCWNTENGFPGSSSPCSCKRCQVSCSLGSECSHIFLNVFPPRWCNPLTSLWTVQSDPRFLFKTSLIASNRFVSLSFCWSVENILIQANQLYHQTANNILQQIFLQKKKKRLWSADVLRLQSHLVSPGLHFSFRGQF